MVDLKKTPPLLGGARHCANCGLPLPKHAGTGRPPLYCQECKPRPAKPTVIPPPPAVRTVEGTLDYSKPGPGTAFRQVGDKVLVGEAAVASPAPRPQVDGPLPAAATESELQSAMDDLVSARRDLAAAKAKLAKLLEGV